MSPSRRNTNSGKSLNTHGDLRVLVGESGFGADISSQREDDLDFQALKEAKGHIDNERERRPVVYDIGCGQGAMAIKFLRIGCAVIACDIEPMNKLAKISGNGYSIQIVESDARHVNWEECPMPDIVYSQRFLHFLRFFEAVDLIQTIVNRSKKCSLFLSLSGSESELAVGYPSTTLTKRYFHLADNMKEKHGIYRKVCLYSLEDARQLAVNCKLNILQLWLSEFGNIKMIATK